MPSSARLVRTMCRLNLKMISVNLNHCSDVKIVDSRFAPPKVDFLSYRLNTAKLETRRVRNVEEKQNDAYAATAEIDPLGIDLFSKIKMQLPDGLRWAGKDIEVQGVRISPPYSEAKCVLKCADSGNKHALSHIRNIVKRFHETRQAP